MSARAFLAVDWGTTNLRAWVVGADGEIGARGDFPELGVGRLSAPGEAAHRFREQVRPAMHAQHLPVVMAGMIGSTLGWRETAYVDCPADAAALARGVLSIPGEAPAVCIAPGLRCRRPDLDAPDVMRGEEVQIMGWIAADPAHARGRWLVCHPGTHAKWVEVVDGRVIRFVTAMTGELFDVLSTHGVLRSPPGPAAGEADGAFDAGLEAAGDGDALASRLFTVRSRVVGGDMPRGDARGYLSGLLIGADVAALPSLLGFDGAPPVALIGEPALTRLYARALARRGTTSTLMSGDEAVVGGLIALNAALTGAAA